MFSSTASYLLARALVPTARPTPRVGTRGSIRSALTVGVAMATLLTCRVLVLLTPARWVRGSCRRTAACSTGMCLSVPQNPWGCRSLSALLQVQSPARTTQCSLIWMGIEIHRGWRCMREGVMCGQASARLVTANAQQLVFRCCQLGPGISPSERSHSPWCNFCKTEQSQIS